MSRGDFFMPIKYKIDILAALKNAGYSSYRIRKEKIFGEATLQKIRKGEILTADNLALICKFLNCQPGDILEYVSDDETSNKHSNKIITQNDLVDDNGEPLMMPWEE